MTYQELLDLIKKGKVSHVQFKGFGKRRVTTYDSNTIFAYKPRSRKYGNIVHNLDGPYEVEHIAYCKEKDPDREMFRGVLKYRKLAEKASFTNSFIKACLEIPDTFEKWVEEGKKDLYEYGATTGNAIDGKVITLDRIAKKYPQRIAELRRAIKQKTEGYICSRMPFAGYEMSINTACSEGEFRAYLSLEYKDCGNGYYYLLIHDEAFIGYDVD